MLFHEIYGSYYHTVSSILAEAVRGTLTEKSGEVGGIYRLRFGGYEI